MRDLAPTYASVAKLRQLCDPFERICWRSDLDRPLLREEVFAAAPLATGRRWRWRGQLRPPVCTREEHAGRIRWLMEHGWRAPIAVDVGIPSMGCHVAWPIIDGNHRFAAAILRGDERIRADFAGDVKLIHKLLARPPSRAPAGPGSAGGSMRGLTRRSV